MRIATSEWQFVTVVIPTFYYRIRVQRCKISCVEGIKTHVTIVPRLIFCEEKFSGKLWKKFILQLVGVF